MEKYFKTIDGQYVNIVKHTLEQLNKWPDLKIYISTDSQSFSGFTRYATVIVYRYGTRGAHYIVFKEEAAPKERVEFVRLYNEGVRTVEVAQILRDELSVIADGLEFDYADVRKTVSSALVSSFKGYLNAKFKSSNMIASKAADHECRRGSNIFNIELALKEAA